MADFEVHIELAGRTRRVGLAHGSLARGGETVTFEYDPGWLLDPESFSLEPALGLTPGLFAPPAYDLNPVPVDVKARILSTNIDLDEGTCSLDLLEAASEYYGLGLAAARATLKEVATATAAWRETARQVGARAAEIERMESAFEHDESRRARAL